VIEAQSKRSRSSANGDLFVVLACLGAGSLCFCLLAILVKFHSRGRVLASSGGSGAVTGVRLPSIPNHASRTPIGIPARASGSNPRTFRREFKEKFKLKAIRASRRIGPFCAAPALMNFPQFLNVLQGTNECGRA